MSDWRKTNCRFNNERITRNKFKQYRGSVEETILIAILPSRGLSLKRNRGQGRLPPPRTWAGRMQAPFQSGFMVFRIVCNDKSWKSVQSEWEDVDLLNYRGLSPAKAGRNACQDGHNKLKGRRGLFLRL